MPAKQSSEFRHDVIHDAHAWSKIQIGDPWRTASSAISSSVFRADHISLGLGSHIAQTYGGMRSIVAPQRGVLAPWQERRAKELLSANLLGDISIPHIARQCSLSIGHFARAFRQTTGLSLHQWLLRHRIDQAHGLLRDGRLSLAEVARACGFADRSHSTRV
jgi:AraC-like DNA-binding protein